MILFIKLTKIFLHKKDNTKYHEVILLKNHTLKGQNRESTVLGPPDILAQGTKKYDNWNNIPTIHISTKPNGRRPCEPSLISYYAYHSLFSIT